MQGFSTALRQQVESALGRRIASAAPVAGGHSPAIRQHVEFEDGSTAFVKVGTTDHTVQALREERAVYDHIDAPFLARVLAWAGDDSCPILVLEDLRAAHWPPPWTPEHVQGARDTLAAIHATPPPPGCGPASRYREELLGWERVAEDASAFLSLELASRAWLDASLPALRDAAHALSFEGDDFLHFDVRSDNLCLRDGQAVFIDWNWACVGNGALDRGFWLPSLAAEGGPLPDEVLPGAPECAALVAGYFAAQAGLPPVPVAPKVRPLQRLQLRTALPWAVRALGLSPLDGANAPAR